MKEFILTDTSSIRMMAAELEKLRLANELLTHENRALRNTLALLQGPDDKENEAKVRAKIERYKADD